MEEIPPKQLIPERSVILYQSKRRTREHVHLQRGHRQEIQQTCISDFADTYCTQATDRDALATFDTNRDARLAPSNNLT